MLGLIAAVFAALASISAAQAAPLETRCHVDGFETPVRCVSLEVPVDYDVTGGVTMKIGAAIVPATTARPAPDPLFVFAGGPGQAATKMGPWLDFAFKPARRARDIVLFDIRGTGLSAVADCSFAAAGSAEEGKRDTAVCAAKVGDKTKFMSSREAVEDIERLRRALGYDKINLWGGSFGTRLSQHYVRKYGAHVRAVVLDAATPVGTSIFVSGPVTGERALERLLTDCKADAACAAAFPSLAADFASLMARAERGEIRADVIDPRSGRASNERVELDTVIGLVRGALYVGLTRAVLPYAITRANIGDMKPLLALGTATAEWSAESMTLPALLGIICAEDQVMAERAGPAKRNQGFMRDSYFRAFDTMCAAWPHRALPDEMLQPMRSGIPALAISGDLDPVTPPSLADETLAQFATRVHAIVPNGFHTNSASSCVAKIIGSFLDDPATGGRDHACLARSPKPHFLTSPNV